MYAQTSTPTFQIQNPYSFSNWTNGAKQLNNLVKVLIACLCVCGGGGGGGGGFEFDLQGQI